MAWQEDPRVLHSLDPVVEVDRSHPEPGRHTAVVRAVDSLDRVGDLEVEDGRSRAEVSVLHSRAEAAERRTVPGLGADSLGLEAEGSPDRAVADHKAGRKVAGIVDSWVVVVRSLAVGVDVLNEGSELESL